MPSLDSPLLGDDAFHRMAAAFDIDRRPHSYWQFYLPTSLAACNLLSALARGPERWFALTGTLYVAQAGWLAFETALAKCCPHLVTGASVRADGPLATLLKNVESAARLVRKRHGEGALAQMNHGIVAAAKLAERGRWDLGEQLEWLSAIDQYRRHAETISRRIDAECPDIDRETFVEPRDMCSTTHVHSDHRLVTIQEGVMHFWGNLGMRLEMHPGDKVLIPEGRLHGSTVLSAECTPAGKMNTFSAPFMFGG